MIAFWRGRLLVDDARPDDARALSDIHERSFDRGWSTEDMRALIADYPTVQPLVLRRSAAGQTRIAGFVVLRIAGGEAEILTLAVGPKSRRRGFGRLLMEEAARRVYRDRADAIFLEVDEANRAAVGLYEALGFRTVGQRSRYYQRDAGAPGTALVMRLSLR